ncbi:MAG: thiamine phosphate synthase [Planctomycetes bacterium]|nr:thiamine phosphate synthase [Planctomycetota bacterium]MBM4085876.1 thiamine phosphate synthase [Planctomycetota bacterium]
MSHALVELREKLTAMRLYVLVTGDVAKRLPLEAAKLVIAGGADVVQLREKTMADGEFLVLARQFRELTAKTGTLFIVNDRAEMARLADADGVHLGQDDLPVAEARKILGRGTLIGVSTHAIDQARRAVADGADYIGVGPVYPTKTKGYEQGVGLQYVRQVASELDVPFVAIGAITLERLPEVMAAGAKAVAVSSAIIAARDPKAMARAFKQKLSSAVVGSRL